MHVESRIQANSVLDLHFAGCWTFYRKVSQGYSALMMVVIRTGQCGLVIQNAGFDRRATGTRLWHADTIPPVKMAEDFIDKLSIHDK